MKGLCFHWEPPFRDVYSGMDPFADAWTDLASAFDLQLAAIVTFPLPRGFGIPAYESLEGFLQSHEGEAVALATPGADQKSVRLADIEWLVFGPASGFDPAYLEAFEGETWSFEPSPDGGFHSLHLAHIAAASEVW